MNQSAPIRSDDEVCERLLTTAQRLFCRYGVQATGVARVIEEAGVSRKALYARFRSKDELVRAVLDREGAEWRAWFVAGIDRLPGSPRDRLLGIFDLLADWFGMEEFYGCAFINAVAEHDKVQTPVADAVAEHRTLTDAILLDLARSAGAQRPEVLVRGLSILIDGAIVTAMLERNGSAAADARAIAAPLIDAQCRNPAKCA